MKIFMGLTEIAGYYSSLENSFAKLGIYSKLIDLSDNKFKYKNKSFFLVDLVKKIHKIKHNNFIIEKILYLLRAFSTISLFIYCLFKFDVFIFGMNSSFYKYYDLPILKFFKKKIIYIFHGSDGRVPYLDGAIMSNNRSITSCIEITKEKKDNIRKIEKYADFMISTLPISFFNKKDIISCFIIGIPCNVQSEMDKYVKINSEMIKIIHSPSNPEAKGTEIISRAINNLKSKGYNIDFVLIKDMPNDIVIDNIKDCDFVVDQMYADTPMAGFACEAASFGKPAIVCGYYCEQAKKEIPLEQFPPSYYCHPEQIEFAIEELIKDEASRLKIGRDSFEFVKNFWSKEKVAERILMLINNNYPKSWFYDINNIDYFCGAGLSKEKIKSITNRILTDYGVEAFQLSDKPELEAKFLAFLEKL